MSFRVFKIKKHEKNVENFYTTGSKMFDYQTETHPNEGFISFGYWEKAKDDYIQAARDLLSFFIKNSGIKKSERILNVACGYGSESFAFFEKFKPKELIGIDITKVHTDYANLVAKKKGVSKKVRFVHGDAVQLGDFKDSSFSHILGIEGPAHFNTREKFFFSANRVLKKNGELLLTDVVLGDKCNKKNPFHKFLLFLGAKGWVAPDANKVNSDEYEHQLKRAGFEVVFMKKIGDKVFPGYANSFNLKHENDKSVKMGFLPFCGLSFIGKLLGTLYNKGLIDYIYVKARKI